MSKIPTLRFKEFNGEWEEERIGNITDCIVPGRNKPKSFSGTIPWITTPDIIGKYIYTSKINLNISKVEAKNIGSKIVPKNSIIMSCVGELGLLSITNNELIINQQLHAFIPNRNINVEFLFYSLSTQKRYMEKVATKTTLLYMNKNSCNSIPIKFPPKQEQEKIASFITSIDTKIEQLAKKESLLKEYKKGVMQKIFNQEIRFKADDGSEFCDWEEKKIGELPIMISDGNYGELYPTSNDFKSNGIAFLRANNLKNLKIDDSDTKYISEEQHSILTSGHLHENDILITTRGELGNIALVDSKHNGSNINAQICLLRITNINELNYLYLLYILDYRDSKKQYKAFETGTALKQLPKGNLRKVQIKLPCYEEQIKIANFLSSIDNKIEQTQKQLEKTNEFKKALLQQMFV